MCLIDLRLKETREILKHHALRDLPMIGRGSFAVVYDKSDTVVKLTVDQFQHDFYTSGIDNPIFPKVVRNYGQVGEIKGAPAFLIEMEKLNHVAPGTHAQDFVFSFIDKYAKAYPAHDESFTNSQCSAEALANLADEPIFPGLFRHGILELAEFVLVNNCAADFHKGNFMLRGSQVVLNDPVSDQYLLPF